MTSLSWTRTSATLLCCALTCGRIFAADAPAPRPNFLFLLSDDQRADTIAAHGNPHIRTPNLDLLVKGGFSFRHNYCFGGNSGAVCVPSRAMINSGRVWLRVNNKLEGVKILPELLRENGYTTFGTGKWHNGQPSFLRGFERGKAVFFGGMSDHTKVPLVDISEDGQPVHKRTGNGFSSELFADAAIEFIEGHDGEKPFYAYVAFTAPHDPRQPPLEYRQLYYSLRPPLPENFLPQHPFDNGHMKGGRDENLAPWPRTKEVISDQLAEYYGLITHMDEQIGRILAALRDSGKRDNTVIVFAADQGLAMGSHGLLGKQSVYEHSMRSPLIVAGPGIPRGGFSRAFTYLHDIYPTVCSLAGLTPPADIDGKSLVPIWQGRTTGVRDSVFLAFLKIQRAVRDSRYKLIAYPQIDYLQLFDLREDPHEMRNLAGDPDEAERIRKLLALMKEWQQRFGDEVSLPTRSKEPEKIDLTGRKRKPDRWQPQWIVEKYFNEPESGETPSGKAPYGKAP
jgi:arylsulfatase A-like enzyme